PRAVAISVAVSRGRRAPEIQHFPSAACARPVDHQPRGWLSDPNSSRCASESREKSALSRERATGVEPATSSLGSWHSTTELRPHRVETLAEPVAPRNPGAPGTPAPAAN